MFSENQLPLGNTDRFGRNDFVGERILEDAVLVNAGFVGKRVRAYDRFVRRYRRTCNFRQQAAGGIELFEADIGSYAERGLPHIQQHDDFFQCGISRAFADAINGQFELARARLYRGERVGDAQAEIVMAMRAQRNAIRAVQIKR